MEVCIVGSGFFGIISAKIALEKGLTPVIITKDPQAGGLWNSFPGRIGPWDSMLTNGSKFFFAFSDHPLNKEVNIYPTKKQIAEYLNSYVTKHDLQKYCIFNSEVVSITQHQGDYQIRWKTNEDIAEKVFKYVVVAPGAYSKIVQPFKNIANYKGTVVQSGLYREPSNFAGKKVVVIGRGFSGSDIAKDISSRASEVTQIFRNPYIVVEFYMGEVSSDIMLCNIHNFNSNISVVPTIESNHEMTKKIIEMIGNPGKWHPDWCLDPDNLQGSIKLIVHNPDYLQAVTENRIKCVKGNMEDFSENGVLLSDGREIEADSVVLCLGYQMDLSFLSDEMKRILKYDINDQGVPYIAYRRVFHPDLPRICFLGAFGGYVPCKFELIAELGLRYITNTLGLPEDKILQGIRDDEYIRNYIGFSTFPYNQEPFIYELIQTLDIKIDMEFIRNDLKFGNGPLLPQFLYLDKPGMKELAREVVEEIKERFPHTNFE